MRKTAFITRGYWLVNLYRDKEFFASLFRIALPIILQNFITSSLNMVGVIMIGQMGDVAIAAVGLSNQIFFLLTLFLFGVNSGAAMFTAQLWGKQDTPSIHKVLRLCLLLGLTGSLSFTILAVLFPNTVLGIYSRDPAVIAQGAEYIQIFGLSFLFTAVTFTFSAALRSTGDVKTPLFVSMSALTLNTLVSYTLIFGKFGLPEMGIRGAAFSILFARILEASLIVSLTYLRKSPVAMPIRHFFQFDRSFSARVLRRVLPVTFNEILWSFGVTVYNIVYARIGTEAIAAVNIAVTIDNLAMVTFIGIGHACAILVGNRIGASEEGRAYQYAGNALFLGVAGAVLVGGLILAGSGSILSLYKVSPGVIQSTRNILTVIAFFLWLRVSNLMLFVGILRSGGDTRFAFFLDVGGIWVIGVPLAFLGAFVFRLPVHLVYLMVMTEELVKSILGLSRFLSRRWIHNLAAVA